MIKKSFIYFVVVLVFLSWCNYYYFFGKKHQPEFYIVIPYRNRENNLKQFLTYMSHYFKSDENVRYIIVEQKDDLKFNRGRLSNAGIKYVSNLPNTSNNTCVVIHDVDLLPFPGIDYSKCDRAYHLSHSLQHLEWKTHYGDYFGGVVTMSIKDWKLCNGFDNDFFGYGAEDDDLFRRCMIAGVIKGPLHKIHVQEEQKYFNIHTKSDYREERTNKIETKWRKQSRDRSKSNLRGGLGGSLYKKMTIKPSQNVTFLDVWF